jgi:hypothetical protein
MLPPLWYHFDLPALPPPHLLPLCLPSPLIFFFHLCNFFYYLFSFFFHEVGSMSLKFKRGTLSRPSCLLHCDVTET